MAEPRLLRRGRGRRAPFPGQPGATRRVTLSATTGVVHGVSRGGRASGVARHRAARGRRQGRARRVLPRPGQRRGSRQAPLGGLLLPAGEPGSLGPGVPPQPDPAGELGPVPDGRGGDVLVPRLLRRRLADPAARPAVLEQVDDSLEDQARQRLPLQLRPASRRRPLALAAAGAGGAEQRRPEPAEPGVQAAGIAVLADRTERLRGARAAAQGATGGDPPGLRPHLPVGQRRSGAAGHSRADRRAVLQLRIQLLRCRLRRPRRPHGQVLAVLSRQRRPPARPGSRRAGQLGRALLPLAVPDPRRAHRRPAGTHRHRRPRPGHRRAVADRCLHLVAQAPGAPLERLPDGC